MSTSDNSSTLGRTRTGRRRRLTAAVAAAVVTVLATTACDAAPPKWQPSARSIGGSPAVTTAPVTPSALPSVSPSPTVSAADACVTATMATMSLRQIAGQVMLVGAPVGNPASIDKLIRADGIGGVFLSGRSHESAAKLRSAISALQATAVSAGGVRLLIALDQEGGEVQTLKGADFPPIPTAQVAGRLSPSALSAQTASWARRLAAIGVTLDLAPVADTVPTSIGTANPPIGGFHRQYGSDPTAVAADIRTVVAAIQSTGVVTTLKHFPGLGRVRANTDTSTKAVDRVTTAHDPYLEPFVAGIRGGTGAVMVSSASYPNLDPHSIATFSEPIVTGLLRDQLGFQGLIVSDALGGAAAVSIVPTGQRAVRFIEAGGDFALTAQLSKAPAMIDGLLAAALASATFTAKLRAAAAHVLGTKYTGGQLACSPSRQ